MKIKTDELVDRALDYAVALCLGGTSFFYDTVATYWITINGKERSLSKGWDAQSFSPSTNWAHGGPIIEREKIDIYQSTGRVCAAMWENLPGGGKLIAEAKDCPTPLIAAMRCYVASKLGDRIEVPKELLK